jgi:SAM-dependent methyltransferase
VGPVSWPNDPDTVRAQYREAGGLQTRMSIWRPPADGVTAQDVVIARLRAAAVRSVLEIGCGTGGLAARIQTELPAAEVIATDQSERMVELTAARGVRSQIAEATDLPFPDGCVDAVVAAWMLYHVPDVDAVLAEVRRVLRPGGVFVAVTNGDRHLADLLTAAGGGPLITGFSSENGERQLRRHFDSVSATQLQPFAVADHVRAQEYLASFDEGLAAALPPYQGERCYPGAVTVFTAH